MVVFCDVLYFHLNDISFFLFFSILSQFILKFELNSPCSPKVLVDLIYDRLTYDIRKEK